MGKNIFIVEDEIIVMMEIRERLSSMGYGISGVCDSGEEALKIIPESAPDLVLMDIRLIGRLSGVDVAKELIENYDIPVIFITAYSDEIMMEKINKLKHSGYLMKPFEDFELRQAIEKVFNSNNNS